MFFSYVWMIQKHHANSSHFIKLIFFSYFSTPQVHYSIKKKIVCCPPSDPLILTYLKVPKIDFQHLFLSICFSHCISTPMSDANNKTIFHRYDSYLTKLMSTCGAYDYDSVWAEFGRFNLLSIFKYLSSIQRWILCLAVRMMSIKFTIESYEYYKRCLRLISNVKSS